MVFPAPFVGSGRNLAQLEFVGESKGATFWYQLVGDFIHFIIIKCVKFFCVISGTSVFAVLLWNWVLKEEQAPSSAERWCKHKPLLSPWAVVADYRGNRIFWKFCVFLSLAVQPAEVFWLAATREHHGIVSFPEQGVVNYSVKGLFFHISEESYCVLYRIEDIKPRF